MIYVQRHCSAAYSFSVILTLTANLNLFLDIQLFFLMCELSAEKSPANIRR